MLNVLSVLDCPFCNGRTGQIAIDVQALNTVREKFPKLDCKNTDFAVRTLANNNVVVFNSTAEAKGPCEHLVHTVIDFDEFPGDWSGCFAWKCPDFDEVAAYLWDVLLVTAAPMLVPKTRCEDLADECLSWPIVKKNGRAARLDVVASAWFAENRGQFIEELRALEARRQEFFETDEGEKTFDTLREMFRRR